MLPLTNLPVSNFIFKLFPGLDIIYWAVIVISNGENYLKNY